MPILWVAERCWYLFMDVAVLMALEFKTGDASIWAKITDNLDICTYGRYVTITTAWKGPRDSHGGAWVGDQIEG